MNPHTKSAIEISDSASGAMDYRELRDVMKFLHSKGWTPKAIYADMCETLGDSAPSYGMVKKWVTEFRKGRISTEDLVRPGRPKDVSTYENLDFIQSLVRDDDRVTVQDIVKLVTISFGSVHTIISKLLELTKVSGRWVQRRIGHSRRMERIDFSKEILARYKLDTGPMVFLTVIDDPWIHHFKRTKLLLESEHVKEFDDFKMPTTSGILNRALLKSKIHEDAKISQNSVVENLAKMSKSAVAESRGEIVVTSNSEKASDGKKASDCDKVSSCDKASGCDKVSSCEKASDCKEESNCEKASSCGKASACDNLLNCEKVPGSVKVSNSENASDCEKASICEKASDCEKVSDCEKASDCENVPTGEIASIGKKASNGEKASICEKAENCEKASDGEKVSICKKESDYEKASDGEKASNNVKVSDPPIQDLNVDSTVGPNVKIDRSTPENGPLVETGCCQIENCQKAEQEAKVEAVTPPQNGDENASAPLGQTPAEASAEISSFGLQGVSLAHLVNNQAQLNAGMLPSLNVKLGMLNPFYGVNMDRFTFSSQNKSLAGQKRPGSETGNSAPPKRMRSNPRSGMSFIFWDSEGVISVENLQPGQQLNIKSHGDMLARLKDAMISKRSGSMEQGVLLVEEHEFEGAKPPEGFQLLRVPQSSPDLSPSDFHIFPKVKEHLRWLPTAEDNLMPAVEKLLKALDSTFFKLALVEMERRCTLCVDQNGDHVEK